MRRWDAPTYRARVCRARHSREGRNTQPSQKRLVILGRVSEGTTPPAGGRGVAPRPDPTYPSRPGPLHAHRLSPNPFSIPSSILYPLTVLYLILLLPIARSAALFVHWTSPAGDGITAPATSRLTPRRGGEESSRRPEPRATNSEDPSRRQREAPSVTAISSP